MNHKLPVNTRCTVLKLYHVLDAGVIKPGMIVVQLHLQRNHETFLSLLNRKLMRSLRSLLTTNVEKQSPTTRLWARSREHLVRIQICVISCLANAVNKFVMHDLKVFNADKECLMQKGYL